ncbi:MAG: 3-hydroxyacyl-CoA dehydrogenase NAD-binding domain-containing protein [Pseudomonadota bacterium]
MSNDWTKYMDIAQIKKAGIGVLGAGQMGSGIAQVALACGLKVTLVDLSDSQLNHAQANIFKGLERWLEKGKLNSEELENAKKTLITTQEISNFKQTAMVIEAATEDESLKLNLFQKLSNICAKDTILATNTSSIPITKIARQVVSPERVVGMHFMNPVPLMQLVEVIKALQTSDQTCQIIMEVSKMMGKTPIEVRDGFGFVANRILLPMINEAIYVLYESGAEAKAIDDIMRLGMNHPIGPLALADMIGLDTCLSVMEVLYQGFNDSKYRPCPLLKQMVDAGYLGKKSKQGFYIYQ